jgi:hypothetical protein
MEEVMKPDSLKTGVLNFSLGEKETDFITKSQNKKTMRHRHIL